MSDTYNIERFVKAQEPVIEQVRAELAESRKRTHWIWFIFPQLAGLGRSETARHFAIGSVDEASAYLRHPVLGPRLIECTQLVNRIEARSIHDIFGSPDDMKFRSCMTLFGSLPGAAPAFGAALAKYFDGAPDEATLRLLRSAAT